MRPSIEMLETRRLLSGNPANVSTDIAAYKAACVKTLSDLSTAEATFHKDFNPIVADLHRLSSNHANAALLNSLNHDGLGGLSKLKADVQKLTSKGLSDLNKIVRSQNRLLQHPSSQLLLFQLEDSIGVFRNDGDTIQGMIVIDANKADDAEENDLAAIDSANSSDSMTHNDVEAAKKDSTSVVTTATADLGSVASSAQALVSDLG